jgi:peptide/nickel transport system substrate-binding protein
VFERFEGYWGKKPALKSAIFKYVKEWSTRKLMLQNGDADRVTVDNPYVPEVREMKNLKLYEVPLLSCSAAFFCQKVNPTANPNIGSGKLDGEGIPPDFFSDINVRKAFLHAFDRKTYAEDVFNNLVVMPTSPNVKGLPYHIDAPVYAFDLKKSEEYLKKAWGGKVWEKGFKMTIVHNTGNEMREAAANMLAENIMSLNPKFKIDVRNVEWKDYLVAYRNYQYPIFLIGWGADYADPTTSSTPSCTATAPMPSIRATTAPRLTSWSTPASPTWIPRCVKRSTKSCRTSGTRMRSGSPSTSRSWCGPTATGCRALCPTPCSWTPTT